MGGGRKASLTGSALSCLRDLYTSVPQPTITAPALFCPTTEKIQFIKDSINKISASENQQWKDACYEEKIINFME